ncbi:pseudouridylate synthase TRUB2, mitochondrial-like [Salvelinus fontinalis]|uniref:pseudouridylate synthase TRUB2, mitochondrial-like n=1 Tax=Salvelinus fontinalis TaxID=8038 RepID=UPI002485103E|nr:pseudouridylate synthase TRUB2, mitochondrial-like [Salvelinus fontinalis]
MMKITVLSHLFKWENLHNWWLTKYFFAPLYSKVDMNNQEAYELAAKVKLRPDGKSPSIMIGLRLLHFQPPHFTLEVQCLNETQQYLCRILHEVGLELCSTAVCKGVRRTRYGPFTVQQALTR